MKILFLDLDGTVRKTKSGATFINDPYDQELIPGVENAIARYKGWKIFGIDLVHNNWIFIIFYTA